MATNFMIPSMYQNPTSGAAPAQASAPSGDASNLVTALVTAFGLIANKVAMYTLLNKDPASTTPNDIALFLEAGGGDNSVTNALLAGEPLQNTLLKEVSTQTFSVLQARTQAQAFMGLAKALDASADYNAFKDAVKNDPVLKKFFGA